MMEAMRSSETSVLTRATQRHIPEDGILHNHRLGNLKSYKLNSLCFGVVASGFEYSRALNLLLGCQND
jgi:hypothetical protein